MKAMKQFGKKRGFFSVGIGLALFALFGAIGTGITVVNDTQERDNEKLAMQVEVNSLPDSTDTLESRSLK
jgi:hypothetical protein